MENSSDTKNTTVAKGENRFELTPLEREYSSCELAEDSKNRGGTRNTIPLQKDLQQSKQHVTGAQLPSTDNKKEYF